VILWARISCGQTVGKSIFPAQKKPANPDKIGILNLQFRDEARHGKAFAGLLKRYFGK